MKCAYLFRKRARNQRPVDFHEAAHAVANGYYGIECHAFIKRTDRKPTAWTGEIRHKRPQPSYFQCSVTSWAGSIVEFLLAWPLDKWPVVSRTPFEAVGIGIVKHYQKYQKFLFNVKLEYAKETGAPVQWFTDLDGIVGTRNVWHALRTSWKIVVSRRTDIARVAEVLMEHGQVKCTPHGHVEIIWTVKL